MLGGGKGQGFSPQGPQLSDLYNHNRDRLNNLSVTPTKRRYSTGVVPFAHRETAMRALSLESNVCVEAILLILNPTG